MAYLGNQPVVGDSANTFKTLDDIASFTVTFDATSSDVVSIANDTLTFNNHRFVTAQKVTYNDGGGTAIGGLSDGSYFIIKEDQNTIKLATSAANAASGTAINLTSGAAGGSHTLKIAFDGINTKFKATHTSGIKAKVSRAAQLSLSINGVIQQPQDTTSPTVGYGVEADSTIVFSTAPEATDKVFGSFIGETAASFDLTDNTVDEFTADGSTTAFTLSKELPSNNDALVTLDGVVQYPNTQSTTRAYSTIDNTITFTSAPAAGVVIQVRHIGFAGASSNEVTAFYGRTGNVQLKNTDNVAVNNLTVAGNLDVTGDITYDETVARNLNITGIATVASGIVSTGDFKVGTATTLSQDNIFTTGIITATSFVGSGANLTGVASTENIRTNTNATFLQNVTVVGTSTVTGNVVPSSDSATDIGTNSVRFQNAYVDTYYGDGSNLTGIDVTGATGDFSIADKIVHTGDTNTAIRFPEADTLTVETNGAERIRIQSNGNTGIGTITAQNSARLQVSTDQQVVAAFEGTGVSDPQIYLGDDMTTPTDNCIILGYDKADNRGYLTVGGDADSVFTVTNGGNIGINKTDPSDKFHVEGTTNFTSNSYIGGDLYMYGSSYTKGIFLGGSGSANKLDDYEEGTWTPSLNNGTASVASGGTYRKIGKLVHLTVLLSSFSDTSSGTSILISGVPFSSSGQNVGTVWLRRTTSGGKGWICTIGDSANNVINIQRHSDGNDMGAALQYSDFAHSSPYMNITITYQTS